MHENEQLYFTMTPTKVDRSAYELDLSNNKPRLILASLFRFNPKKDKKATSGSTRQGPWLREWKRMANQEYYAKPHVSCMGSIGKRRR